MVVGTVLRVHTEQKCSNLSFVPTSIALELFERLFSALSSVYRVIWFLCGNKKDFWKMFNLSDLNTLNQCTGDDENDGYKNSWQKIRAGIIILYLFSSVDVIKMTSIQH